MKKQVYYERRWQLCEFLWQKGEAAGVEIDGLEHVVDYRHVRDVAAQCIECDRYIVRSSYQTHGGTSVCARCYEKLNRDHLNLYFGGPQWMSWDGQMSIGEMETKHLIATIGMLKERSEGRVELLGPTFGYLVEELEARTPQERKALNPFLLYIYTFLMVINGFWNQKNTEDSEQPATRGVPLSPGTRATD